MEMTKTKMNETERDIIGNEQIRTKIYQKRSVTGNLVKNMDLTKHNNNMPQHIIMNTNSK
jgi:hypothetical protein